MTKYMKYTCTAIFLVSIFSHYTALAESDSEVAKHKLRVDVGNFRLPGFDDLFVAGKGSTFYIYTTDEETKTHTIKFNRVKKPTCVKENDQAVNSTCKVVTKTAFYNLDQEQIKSYYYRESLKFDHGILVVPFKFRTEDQSLSGSSTLGYYFGSKSEYLGGSGTYFGSIGLSQVDIPVDNNSTESRTGLSMSAGYIFENTDGFQVALVVGSDRLGGSAGDTWEYEKDVWVSIGLGFNLASRGATRPENPN